MSSDKAVFYKKVTPDNSELFSLEWDPRDDNFGSTHGATKTIKITEVHNSFEGVDNQAEALSTAARHEIYKSLSRTNKSGFVIAWRSQTMIESMQRYLKRSFSICVAWSLDFDKIALAYNDGTLVIATVEGDKELDAELTSVLKKWIRPWNAQKFIFEDTHLLNDTVFTAEKAIHRRKDEYVSKILRNTSSTDSSPIHTPTRNMFQEPTCSDHVYEWVESMNSERFVPARPRPPVADDWYSPWNEVIPMENGSSNNEIALADMVLGETANESNESEKDETATSVETE